MRRLILRPGAIGDTIVSLPALEHLCGNVEAEIWVPARNLPLVRHVAPARSFQEVQLDLLEIDPPPALVARLCTFDEVVSWYGAAREEFRTALAATGVTAKFFHALPPEGAGCHAVDFYLKQVGAWSEGQAAAVPWIPVQRRACGPPAGPSGVLCGAGAPACRVDTRVNERAARRHIRSLTVAAQKPGGDPPSGYIAIHPFSGSPRKNWPLNDFGKVAARLAAAADRRVEWCAGADEALDGARRFETLDGVAQWLAGAALYLGNDSGISHLAAACGTPSVVVFQASDSRVWAPRGPCVTVLEQPQPEQAVTAGLELLRFGASCRT